MCIAPVCDRRLGLKYRLVCWHAHNACPVYMTMGCRGWKAGVMDVLPARACALAAAPSSCFSSSFRILMNSRFLRTCT